MRRGHTLDPLRVALVNDYQVIVDGLASMMVPYAARVQVVELEVGGLPTTHADLALFDTFGGRRHVLSSARAMVDDRTVNKVALYTWDANEELLALASEIGVSGVLYKSAPASELVTSLERVHSGERLGFERVRRADRRPATPDLTAREEEVVALLSLGLTNEEIGRELFLGVETVRTYVRQVYRKLGVKNRTQAALRAVDLGLEPPRHRMTRQPTAS